MHVLAFYQILHIMQLKYVRTIFLQQSNEYSEVLEEINEMTYDTIFRIKKILKPYLVYL